MWAVPQGSSLADNTLRHLVMIVRLGGYRSWLSQLYPISCSRWAARSGGMEHLVAPPMLPSTMCVSRACLVSLHLER